jgi:LIM domain-binding protein 1
MQELMSRHKAYALNPRDCLKTTLFQKWQKMVAPPGKKLSEIVLFLFPTDSKKVRLKGLCHFMIIYLGGLK